MKEKHTKTFSIKVKATFENWDEDVKVTDDLIKEKVESFVKSVFPMNRMTLGQNSGDLTIQLKTVTDCNE